MKKYFWVEYDLDGSFTFYQTANEISPDSYSHLLGPYDTFAKSKTALRDALKFCINSIKGSVKEIRYATKPELE